MVSRAEYMVNDERDSESGEYVGKYPDDVFVTAVRDRAADSPLGFARTADVAESIGCDNATAHRRLHDLADQGVIKRLNISPAVGWRIADAESGEPDDDSDGTRETESESL